tara:strand:+ start:2309 stop:2770 length:462 start_codon:yes stop_codon:yes gene_type:complete
MINLFTTINRIELNNIFFQTPIKNTVIDNSLFIRIIYSTQNLVLNGIFMIIPLNICFVEKIYNKYKCSYNIGDNHNIISEIIKLEQSILQKLNIRNKIMRFKISDQLKQGNIKLFSSEPLKKDTDIVLKVSGVWENDMEYGLTYKFSSVTHQF